MPRQKLMQRSDGRYKCKYQGKQFYGATQKEAYAKRDEYKRRLESGMKAEADGLTVQAYALRWVKTYKSHVSQATYDDYVRILNRFCKFEGYGSLAIRDITTMDIQEFFNSLSGLSRSSIAHARNTISALFRYAVADRVAQFDPTVTARMPKSEKGTHRAITLHERELISNTQHRLRPAVMVMLYAGLRRGEVLALDIDRDVDFLQKKITVREAVRFDNQHNPVIVPPKTAAGIRTIPLLNSLADELRGIHGLLCPRTGGGLMTYTSFKRAWNSYLAALSEQHNGCTKRWYGKKKEHKESDLPPWESIVIRPHDLRHTYCTMLYDAGVDVKTAQKWMGHKHASVTMEIYTHLSDEREIESTDALENLSKRFSGVQNGVQNPIESSENTDLQDMHCM